MLHKLQPIHYFHVPLSPQKVVKFYFILSDLKITYHTSFFLLKKKKECSSLYGFHSSLNHSRLRENLKHIFVQNLHEKLFVACNAPSHLSIIFAGNTLPSQHSKSLKIGLSVQSLMLSLLSSSATALSFMTAEQFAQHKPVPAENTLREMQCLWKCN